VNFVLEVGNYGDPGCCSDTLSQICVTSVWHFFYRTTIPRFGVGSGIGIPACCWVRAGGGSRFLAGQWIWGGGGQAAA